MLLKCGLTLLLEILIASLGWTHLIRALLVLTVVKIRVRSDRTVFVLLISTGLIEVVLVDQTEAIVVVKLGNREVDLNLLLALGVTLHLVQKGLGESTNNTFFIVSYHILEKLVYKFDFEICQVEACVVV